MSPFPLLERQRPLGDERWTRATARRLGLEFTLNPRGRLPKPPTGPKQS